VTSGVPVIGAFIKTPHPIIIEVMALAGYDFLVLDAEHAPFDRTTLDTCLIAGRAAGIPCIVRVPVGETQWILNTLDAGAAGIMVPHVVTVDQAEALVREVRYGPGGRGFAGTSRAAEYATRSLVAHKESPLSEVTLMAQIEDPEGVDNHAQIAAVDGVDALFVGRADLAVSYQYDDFFSPQVGDMTATILGAAGSATGLYCAPGEDTARWRKAGATVFVVGSEHTLIASGGGALTKAFRD
jgi:2-keto-3-deoxy-L-rhamnonate aldolase RhmA